ncbi:MAG: 50S ribosomal protein L25/general stress protein Ctc [Methylococcales bacterium]
MASSFEFEAEVREGVGKGFARRLRRENKVPAILYGGGSEPVRLSLDHNVVKNNLMDEAVYSHILTVRVDGKEQQAILKDMQRHPHKPIIMHMDFQRISKDEKIRVNVPLHFIGEEDSVGVKKGGVLTHNRIDVEVSCLPSDLPEYIEIDVSGIDVGEAVHLSELTVPERVEIIELTHGSGHDIQIVSVQSGKAAEEEEISEEASDSVDDEAGTDSENSEE